MDRKSVIDRLNSNKASLQALGLARLSLFGSIWLLKVAADESTGTLLMCLFVPCYQLYFLFTNLDTAGKPFAVSCYGSFLMTLATGLMKLP